MKKEVKGRLPKTLKRFVFKLMSFVNAHQRIKNKKLRNFTKKVKLVGSKKIKQSSPRTLKVKQRTAKLKLKPNSSFQRTDRFRTKVSTGLSRVLHSLNVYTTKKRKQTIIVSIVAISAILNVFFLSTISAQFFVENNIYSYGNIQTQTAGLNVYEDSSCKVNVSSLPWGNISPGGEISNLVFIKNEGDIPLTLTLDTIDWSPLNAPNYISLDWNYNGKPLNPDRMILVRLTLTVAQNIKGVQTFNFEIIINGMS